MNSLDAELRQRLAALEAEGLRRELRRVDSPQGPRIRIGDRELINFSSNDYLGLANHSALKEAAIRAVEKFGAGAGASRLICGSLSPFHELEEVLAAFKGTEAALTFSTGYATAVGTITALLGKDDIIIVDKLVHACIVDAARLSGAKLRVFAHNDLNDLEQILKWASKARSAEHAVRNRPAAVLVVTESVFSMDGDTAPLREIVALKEKFGAWLMVDEAHATGLYGEQRSGLAKAFGVSHQVEIQMGTLGKALGASGGYICGSRSLIDFLVNRARSFIFSTTPVPAAAGAATAAIRLIQSSEGQRLNDHVWTLANLLEHSADAVGVSLTAPDSLIMPLIIGDEVRAVEAATKLRDQGVFVPAIRYPTVARGAARLRLTLTAAHSDDDVATLTRGLRQIVNLKS